MKRIAPFGTWPSPISANLAASAAPSLDQPQFDGKDIYWLESRPDDNGRNVIVRSGPDDTARDVLPAPYSARSRVHEYGGACYVVVAASVYFVNQSDQRIYCIETNQTDASPLALTPSDAGYRFADLVFDHRRNRLICVCEKHDDTRLEPENFIAAVRLDTIQPVAADPVERLIEGADFYAYPRLNGEGNKLSWLCWDHPSMPWYGCQLWLASIDDEGTVSNAVSAAGGSEESIFQPTWSQAGELYFVSDRNQWWNLYRYDSNPNADHANACRATALCPIEAEFATPLWTLGMSTYGITSDGQIIAAYTRDGLWQLGRLTPNPPGKGDSPSRPETFTAQAAASKETWVSDQAGFSEIETPYTQISAVTAQEHLVCFIGAAADRGNELVCLDSRTGKLRIVRSIPIAEAAGTAWSIPQALTFATGARESCHAFYYPPTHAEFAGPSDTAPPLIVICHGGPTGATGTALNLKLQYWTSRGFAVIDVNYRGSTGYGRTYRERLDRTWGIADVEDVVAAARHAANLGLAAADKMVIRGSSAGGFTVLAALTFHDVFAAGASYYGIGDLETLARDTHKFEARYLDRLVGPYPERSDVYRQRSPIHHAEQLSCPVIFFQGLEDKVVPPNQARAMVEALQSRSIPVELITFANEGHGFRRAENTASALQQELQFYRDVLNLPPEVTG